MSWQIVVSLLVVVPIMLVPVIFVWLLNIGGVYALRRKHQARQKATPR
jgi:hypothetical protein